jgi:hypothetical protein
VIEASGFAPRSQAEAVTTNIPPAFDARPKSRCSRGASLRSTIGTNDCDRFISRRTGEEMIVQGDAAGP